MSVSVELTYEMSKTLGTNSIDLDGASTVADVVRLTRERFGDQGEQFEQLSRVAGVAVNGVLMNHRRGMRTTVSDGDRVTFVKAAAGG